MNIYPERADPDGGGPFPPQKAVQNLTIQSIVDYDSWRKGNDRFAICGIGAKPIRIQFRYARCEQFNTAIFEHRYDGDAPNFLVVRKAFAGALITVFSTAGEIHGTCVGDDIRKKDSILNLG